MRNREVADLLYEIADLLEMKGVEWKPRAYRRAARSIDSISEPIEDIHEREELQEINGVGESISDKISEYLETGELEYYNELRKEIPVDIESLSSVEGVGSATAKKLYKELDLRTLKELEQAAKEGKIAELGGFGEKTQENILKHLQAAKKGRDRILIGKAFPIAQSIQNELKNYEEFDKIKIVGSFRRRRPTIGDVDILAASSFPENAMAKFCNVRDVNEVISQGTTKSSVLVSGGLRIDLRIVNESQLGSAMMYFTGSKDHNIALRDHANKKGWKLSEYGLFEEEGEDEEQIAGKNEEEVYETLGLGYIPPELRENMGEIQAAEKGEIPDLVELKDIKGDLQVHTLYSDGMDTIEEMARKAEKKGYEYILITDHGPGLQVAGGPQSKEELSLQAEEIEKANEELEIEILHGIEANITSNGLDVSKDMIEMLDMLVVAMHRRPENPTETLMQIFEEYRVDILAHPLNRRINRREPLNVNIGEVVRKAAEENVALEINSQPERLDLPWDLIKQYKDKVKFVVSTDAHSTEEFDHMHIGVAQARRGWLEKENVLNAQSLDKMRSYFN